MLRRLPRRVRRSRGVVYALTIWVLVLGTLVTAAGPHGGDADAKRLSIPIPDLARVHAISVDMLVVLVLVLVVVLVRERAPRRVLTTVSVALGAMVAQGILGYVQYARGIPELLVGFHVAGAVLVFGSVHWLLLELHVPVRDAAPDPAAPAVAAGSRPDDATVGVPTVQRTRRCARLGALRVHLVDGTYELFRQFLAPRPGHLDPDGVEVGATRAVVTSRARHARGGRDAPRRRDRSRHRVVPQRPVARRTRPATGIDPLLKAQFPMLEDALARARRHGVGDGRPRSRRRARERGRGRRRRRPRSSR